uniref:Uncharacterized protein n=1 Tax=Arundo donax TaxID=35708 RepID=A0A0A9AS75_ARUDO
MEARGVAAGVESQVRSGVGSSFSCQHCCPALASAIGCLLRRLSC